MPTVVGDTSGISPWMRLSRFEESTKEALQNLQQVQTAKLAMEQQNKEFKAFDEFREQARQYGSVFDPKVLPYTMAVAGIPRFRETVQAMIEGEKVGFERQKLEFEQRKGVNVPAGATHYPWKPGGGIDVTGGVTAPGHPGSENEYKDWTDAWMAKNPKATRGDAAAAYDQYKSGLEAERQRTGKEITQDYTLAKEAVGGTYTHDNKTDKYTFVPGSGVSGGTGAEIGRLEAKEKSANADIQGSFGEMNWGQLKKSGAVKSEDLNTKSHKDKPILYENADTGQLSEGTLVSVEKGTATIQLKDSQGTITAPVGSIELRENLTSGGLRAWRQRRDAQNTLDDIQKRREAVRRAESTGGEDQNKDNGKDAGSGNQTDVRPIFGNQ
jgi:hypothetical protein